MRSCPEGRHPSLVSVQSRSPLFVNANLLNNCSLSFSVCLYCNFMLPTMHFLSKLYIFQFYLTPCSFSMWICVRVISNNHSTDSMLSCFEIFSAKGISPLDFSQLQASSWAGGNWILCQNITEKTRCSLVKPHERGLQLPHSSLAGVFRFTRDLTKLCLQLSTPFLGHSSKNKPQQSGLDRITSSIPFQFLCRLLCCCDKMPRLVATSRQRSYWFISERIRVHPGGQA